MDADFSEFHRLANDLQQAPVKAVPALRAQVQRSAGRLRNDLRADATGHRFLPHFPRSITAATKTTPTGVEAEVGPDKRLKQGPLGNILYFGTSTHGPILDINGPADREEPRFVKAIEDTASKALE